MNKNFPDITHLPSMMLLIGYPVFWIELYCFNIPYGRTSVFATVLFGALSLWVFYQKRYELASVGSKIKDHYRQETKLRKLFLIIGGAISLLVFSCTMYAASLPPHLLQELDAIHYHLTLPRQHLILNSFAHIPWAADDLFLLPLNFSLAPYWFVTPLPNKFPQFLFSMGLIFIAMNLLSHFQKEDLLSRGLVCFAILGSHNIGIQLGTAMLDLVICYLFLAALDSFLKGNFILGTLEFTFFFWSKSFVPIQIILIMIGIFVVWMVSKKFNFTRCWGILQKIDCPTVKIQTVTKKCIPVFLTLSLLIGGPFVIKSLYYSGTPLFPFSPGLIEINNNINYDSQGWRSLTAASEIWTQEVRDKYGHGRSFLDFLKHFWLVAVPEKGVRNTFDYPLGLIYLVFIGPFLALWTKSLSEKRFGILSCFVVCYWGLWWMGSQQSRFLYIPVVLMIILVLAELRNYSRIFLGVILFALLLNALSVVRAHKSDLGKSFFEVMRPKDRALYQMSQDYIKGRQKGVINLEYHDVAYAQFPVNVTKEQLPHTIAY